MTDVSGVKTAIVGRSGPPALHRRAPHGRVGAGRAARAPTPISSRERSGCSRRPPATDLRAFDRLKGVVLSLGADVLVLSAADHDRLVAVVSHVPHLVAATLMNSASTGAEQDGALLRLAAGGFRDMTRVAAGHPGIWPDICAENATAIVDALDALVRDLRVMRDRVATHDRDAPPRRPPAGQRGAGGASLARVVRPEHLAELRIPVPDRAGVLAEITSLAADAGIGIYDIEIAHSAEGPRGVLILVVDGAHADILTAAVEVARVPVPSRAPVMTAPRVLVVTAACRAAVPCARRVRSRSRTGPSCSAHWPRGPRVIHGLSDGADVAGVPGCGGGDGRRGGAPQ